MSIHSSLRGGKTLGAQRSVMKRYERVRHLMEKGLWTEGRSVLGLPKIKQERIKAQKSAPKEKAEAAAPEGTAEAPAKPSGSTS